MAIGQSGKLSVELPSYNLGTGWVSIYWREEYDYDTCTSKIVVYKATVYHGTWAGTFSLNATVYVNGESIGNVKCDTYFDDTMGDSAEVKPNGSSVSFTSKNISHDTDGTKSIEISMTVHSASIQSWYVTDKSNSTTIGLTDIPIKHILSISQGIGSSIAVHRTSSNVLSTGALSNGATIYEGDKLTITFTANTGYNIATHTVNGSTHTSGGSYTVPQSLSGNTLRVASTATVKSYTLSIGEGTGSTITVNRTSSPKQGASTGNLSNGATIYHFDILQISFSANDGYDVGELTVNSTTVASDLPHEVTDNVTVTSTASLKVYKLTLEAGKGSTITVNRESSLRDGAELGVLANDADIYHFDVLVVTFAVTPEYEILTQTVNSSNFVSGNSHTVTGAVEVATTTRLLGIIYIDNGTKFEKYAVFVDNGTGWDQYIPYIDNGNKFVQYS